MNRIRLAAEKHLGESGRESLEKSYASAIDAIHRGEGSGAIAELVASLEATASQVGGSALKSSMSSELALLAGQDEPQR